MSEHSSQQRRTHCPKGHALEGTNLAVHTDYRPNGHPRIRRRCRACMRARDLMRKTKEG